MSEDPKLFDAGDYNLFRYCNNDPIDFTDPMGLEETPPPGPNHASPLIEQSKRQMHFDRSNGAIREVANRIAEWAQQAWKRLNPPPPPGVKMGTVIAAAPIEEAPAALASLGRLISKTLRASEAETTSTALSTIRVTRPGESFYRYETANPAFSRITESGGVTPKTFAAPTSDGVVPLHLRGSAYKLPNPEIPRPVVRSLSPPPGTAIIGPRSVIEGTKNEVMFPFGY